jgi:hypothetical protein
MALVCRLIVIKVQIAAAVPPKPTMTKAQVAQATSHQGGVSGRTAKMNVMELRGYAQITHSAYAADRPA